MRDYFRAVVVEAHSIDERARIGKTKQSRTRVARLRMQRHRSDFDESESERGEHRHHQRVLVESGGDADRRTKFHAEELTRGARGRRAEFFDRTQHDRNLLQRHHLS